MPFLIWNRRGQATNSGAAAFPVTDAVGVGHIVVEEIDGHADFPVTDASGIGHHVTPQPPVPPPVRVVGGPIPRPRTRRIFGSGHAEFAVFDARGIGSIRLPKRTGVGRAMFGLAGAVGTGRVLPRVSGTGSADFGYPEAFGSGIVVGPTRPRPIPTTAPVRRTAPSEDEYDGYVASMPTTRRRVSRVDQVDDELDELILMGIL